MYSTVTKMNSQGMSMLVETPEQYLDIFQCLKDEVTTREVRGYIDLDLGQSSIDTIDSQGGDEVIYNEVLEYDNYVKRDYSYDQEGEYSNYDSHSL